ncbi:hypothetical protein EJB05_29835, partial [Eragrostis curvula]
FDVAPLECEDRQQASPSHDSCSAGRRRFLSPRLHSLAILPPLNPATFLPCSLAPPLAGSTAPPLPRDPPLPCSSQLSWFSTCGIRSSPASVLRPGGHRAGIEKMAADELPGSL